MPLNPIIVTVSGGVADIASNPDNLPITIIDYDNLAEVICESPTGEDRPLIDSVDAKYLMTHDPEFWNQLSQYVRLPTDDGVTQTR